MAIKKQVTTETGAVAEYWRIERFWAVDVKTQGKKQESYTDVVIHGYLNKEMYDKGMKPVINTTTKKFDAFIPTRESAYLAVKGLGEFSGAEDC